ncbi:hypothetical protein C0989_010827, partial [Termitomyces sp. Mn162]
EQVESFHLSLYGRSSSNILLHLSGHGLYRETSPTCQKLPLHLQILRTKSKRWRQAGFC